MSALALKFEDKQKNGLWPLFGLQSFLPFSAFILILLTLLGGQLVKILITPNPPPVWLNHCQRHKVGSPAGCPMPRRPVVVLGGVESLWESLSSISTAPDPTLPGPADPAYNPKGSCPINT